jgi:hypothetical protein
MSSQSDAHDDGATGHVGRGDDVREGDQLHLVGQHGEEVGHLGAAGGRVEAVADRVLHEGVGREDEVGRQHGADVDQPHAAHVELLGEPAPAEDPQAEEGRLQEEGEQGLEGQRRAEDVTDEAAVVAPVHPELELLDDAGDQAEGEVDHEELAEELGQSQPLRLVRAHPHEVEVGDDEGHADRDRHEEEVVDGRDGELPSRQVEGVHPGPPGDLYYRT